MVRLRMGLSKALPGAAIDQEVLISSKATTRASGRSIEPSGSMYRQKTIPNGRPSVSSQLG